MFVKWGHFVLESWGGGWVASGSEAQTQRQLRRFWLRQNDGLKEYGLKGTTSAEGRPAIAGRFRNFRRAETL